MTNRRSFDDLVDLNDNAVLREELSEAFPRLRRTDASASFLWKHIIDGVGPSWCLENLSLKSVPELPVIHTADNPPSFDWFLSLPDFLTIDKSVTLAHVAVYVH